MCVRNRIHGKCTKKETRWIKDCKEKKAHSISGSQSLKESSRHVIVVWTVTVQATVLLLLLLLLLLVRFGRVTELGSKTINFSGEVIFVLLDLSDVLDALLSISHLDVLGPLSTGADRAGRQRAPSSLYASYARQACG